LNSDTASVLNSEFKNGSKFELPDFVASQQGQGVSYCRSGVASQRRPCLRGQEILAVTDLPPVAI